MKKSHLSNLRFSPARWRDFLFRFTIRLIIIFSIVFLAARGIRKFLLNADTFKIKRIILEEESAERFSYLKARNIFSLNLKAEAGYLQELYPMYREIRLIRILPDKLFIDFIKRRPVAIIRLSRNFYLDENMVIFDSPWPQENNALPVIVGLERKIFAPQAGKKYNIAELALVLDTLKELKKDGVLEKYRIQEINLADFADLSLLIFSGPRVRLGQGGMREKMKLLSGLLKDSQKEFQDIKYIDLRFKEPLIKFK